MKKILSSLPVRLIIGVVIGIIIGLGSADLWIGGTDVGGTIMQVVLTLKKPAGLTDQFLCPADHHRLYCPVYHPSAEQCLPDAGPGAGTGLYLLSLRRTDVNGGRLRHHPRPVHPVGGGGAEEAPELLFNLDIAPVMSVMSALVFSVLVGLAAT